MKVRKVRVALKDAPRADVLGLPIPALAWTDGAGTVFYVLPGRRRFAHELEHNLTGLDNAGMHHPPEHFCVRVGHAIRLRDAHCSQQALDGALLLLAAPDDTWIDV